MSSLSKVVLLREDVHDYVQKAPFSEGKTNPAEEAYRCVTLHWGRCVQCLASSVLFLLLSALKMVQNIDAEPKHNVSGTPRRDGKSSYPNHTSHSHVSAHRPSQYSLSYQIIQVVMEIA